MARPLNQPKNHPELAALEPLIQAALRRYRWLQPADVEDLEQEGRLAAFLALRSYDASAGIAFSTHIYNHVRWAAAEYRSANLSPAYIPEYRLREYKRYRAGRGEHTEATESINQAINSLGFEQQSIHPDYAEITDLAQFREHLLVFLASLKNARATIWIESAGFFGARPRSGADLAKQYGLRNPEHVEHVTRDLRNLFKKRLLSGRPIDRHGLQATANKPSKIR